MKLKILLLTLLTLLIPSLTLAQGGTTTVTATVLDPVGKVYTNSQVNISFYDPGTSGILPLINGSTFQKSIPVFATDSFGSFTSQLTDNSLIASTSGATGTQWRFSICYSDRVTCFSTLLTISGSSMNITTQLQAAAALLPTVSSPCIPSCVNTWDGRTGTVSPAFGDYSFSLIAGSLLHSQLPTLLSADIPNNSANTSGSSASSSFSTTTGAFNSSPTVCTTPAVAYGINSAGNALCYTPSFSGLPGVSVVSGVLINTNDFLPYGPNPWVDTRAYGVRGVVSNATPAIPGITGTILSGTTSLTLSTSSCPSQTLTSCFKNGDGIVVYAAGPINTITTPSAPTVTPSTAQALTGSLLDVASPAGSTAYAYSIVARDANGGLTIASSNGTTVTGAATLGVQTVNIASITMSNNIVTVQTSAAHNLSVGSMFVTQGVTQGSSTAPNPFNQWAVVATVPDNTHFTFTTSSDTRNGAAATGAGSGTVTYWNSNHLTWAPVSGAFQYYIYGRTAGSLTLIGVSWPQNTILAGDPTYLAFDDFGPVVTTYANPPSYVPSTPPVSATNDMLATTIVSGAGTTTLTLANTATNSVSSSTVLFDDAVTFLAAANAAGNSSILLPYGGSYVFNSPITIPSSTAILQEGSVVLNETVTLTGESVWRGAADKGSSISFQYQSNPSIIVAKASPGLYSTGAPNLFNLSFSTGNYSGGTMVLWDETLGNIPGPIFSNVNWSLSGGSTDYNTLGLVFRGTHSGLGGGAVATFTNTIFTSSQNASLVATYPAFYANNYAGINFTENLFLSGKGILIRPSQQGGTVTAKAIYTQAAYMPLFSFTNAQGGGTAGAGLIAQGCIFDTTTVPFAANLGGLNFGLNTLGCAANAALNVTGVAGSSTNDGQSQNTNSSFVASPWVLDGNFFNNITAGQGQISQQVYNTSLRTGSGYSIFVPDATPAAPTCVTNSTGPPYTGTGTWQFIFAWEYANGGTGNLSAASASCTANGTSQQIAITLPSAPITAGGFGAYIYASNNGGVSYSTIGNVSPTTTSQTYTFTTFTVGCNTATCQNGPGSGPAGIGPNGIFWAKNAYLFNLNMENGVQGNIAAYGPSGALLPVQTEVVGASFTSGVTDFCSQLVAAATSVNYQNAVIDMRGSPYSACTTSNPLSGFTHIPSTVKILMPCFNVTTTVGWAMPVTNDLIIKFCGRQGGGGLIAAASGYPNNTPLMSIGVSTHIVVSDLIQDGRLDCSFTSATGCQMLAMYGVNEHAGAQSMVMKGQNSATLSVPGVFIGDIVSGSAPGHFIFYDNDISSVGANDFVQVFTDGAALGHIDRITCNNTGANSGLDCIHFQDSFGSGHSLHGYASEIHAEGLTGYTVDFDTASFGELLGADCTGTCGGVLKVNTVYGVFAAGLSTVSGSANVVNNTNAQAIGVTLIPDSTTPNVQRYEQSTAIASVNQTCVMYNAGDSCSKTVAGKLLQQASNNWGGTCTMSSGTTCTVTLTSAFTTPVCQATMQSSGTVIAGECSVSGVTVTVTAASSNSNVWGVMVYGNPN